MKRPHDEDGGADSDVEMSRLEGVPSQGEIPEDLEEGEQGDDKRTAREVAEDLRFRGDLADLKNRQEPKVVNSLEGLALQCVNDNTDYFVDKQDLINKLPRPVFQLLVNFLQKSSSALPPKVYSSLIISEKTQSLRVSMNSKDKVLWNPGTVSNVLRLIQQKCKHTLTSLELRAAVSRFPGDEDLARSLQMSINVTLSGLKNLSELSGDFFTDDTLRVLGENCEHLRTLKVYYCESVTDAGIDYLCADGQCKNLESLDVTGTSVTSDGLVTALSNLPKLNILIQHNKLLWALEKFVDINGDSKQLQLKQLGNFVSFTSAKSENVCKIIPHVSKLFIQRLENIGALSHLDAISEIQISRLNTSLPEFNFFINKFSSSLTSVQVWGSTSQITIDITVFALCPNLKLLHLDGDLAPSGQFELLPDSFMKLTELHIYNRNLVFLDVSFVMQFISSPTLSVIILGSTISLPEENLYSLIVEAKEKQQVFSSVEQLKLMHNEY